MSKYIITEYSLKAEIDELYEDWSLTFVGTTIDDSNLDFLVNWLHEHDCYMIKPEFYLVRGKFMNEYCGLTKDPYSDNLNILCIKLSNLTNVEGITLPRFELGGRWFTDVVDNNRRHEEEG